MGTRGEPANAAATIDRRGDARRARLAGHLAASGCEGCAGLGWPGAGTFCFCCCACNCNCSCRAFSCGTAKKYCQPSSTSADSTMARMVFLLSVIEIPCCHLRLACTRRARLRNPVSYGQTAYRAPRAFRQVHSHVRREAGLRPRAALFHASDGAPCYARRRFPPSSTP